MRVLHHGLRWSDAGAALRRVDFARRCSWLPSRDLEAVLLLKLRSETANRAEVILLFVEAGYASQQICGTTGRHRIHT